MPPDYRAYVKKSRGGVEWGNTYAITAASETAAYAVAQAIGELERSITWVGVQFMGIRISTWAADGRTGRTHPFSGNGSVNVSNIMPPEVCVRVQLFPGVKQASVKFYRFACDGNEQAEGYISNSRHYANHIRNSADCRFWIRGQRRGRYFGLQCRPVSRQSPAVSSMGSACWRRRRGLIGPY